MSALSPMWLHDPDCCRAHPGCRRPPPPPLPAQPPPAAARSHPSACPLPCTGQEVEQGQGQEAGAQGGACRAGLAACTQEGTSAQPRSLLASQPAPNCAHAPSQENARAAAVAARVRELNAEWSGAGGSDPLAAHYPAFTRCVAWLGAAVGSGHGAWPCRAPAAAACARSGGQLQSRASSGDHPPYWPPAGAGMRARACRRRFGSTLAPACRPRCWTGRWA